MAKDGGSLPSLSSVNAFGIYDREDKRSLLNIVWAEFRAVMLRHEASLSKEMLKSEYKLRKDAKIDPMLVLLRTRFWSEYDRCQSAQTKMSANGVIAGACNYEYFAGSVCEDVNRLAFLLTPPPNYMARLDSMHLFALDEVMDVLDLPLRDGAGKLDHKLASLKVKIFEMLDVRVKGAITQKVQIDQRVLTKSADDPLKNLNVEDLEALDKNIQLVRKQIEKAQMKELPMPAQIEFVDAVASTPISETVTE